MLSLFHREVLIHLSRLTAGCLLIAAGSIADVMGSRMIFIAGCALQGIFVLACGLAKTGIQLILFRAMQGISVAMCLPTAVSIVTTAFQQGQRRNLGFALSVIASVFRLLHIF